MNTLSYKTKSANAASVERKWHVIDVEGEIVGRVASKIATVLRGKHKPDFTPHFDNGDHVVVINADKVRFTGEKLTDKKYLRHTGYPGGQRAATPRDLFAKKPERVLLQVAGCDAMPFNLPCIPRSRLIYLKKFGRTGVSFTLYFLSPFNPFSPWSKSMPSAAARPPSPAST